MKKLLRIGGMALVSLILPLVVNAQTYDWSMHVGGVGASGNDQVNSVAVDGSDNIFIGGYATSSPASAVNFNPLGTASNLNITVNNDACMAKYNSSGILQKAFKWTATLDDKIYGVCTDASGNAYATGYGKGTINLDPAFGVPSVSAGSGGIIVAKYPNTLATVTWGFSIYDGTGSSGNIGYGIATDASGNVYVTGTYAGTNVNFNPLGTATTMSTTGSSDINGFIAKYNSSGILQWAIDLGSTGSDAAFGIALDGSNNVYVTGKFVGTVDFDPSASTANLTEFAAPASGDGFVAKYNTSGAYQWAIAITGSSLQEQGRSIDVTSSGTVFVTGIFQATTAPYTYFDAGGTATLISAGGTDMFLASYSTSGTYLWAKRAGGTTDDAGTNVTLDASGQPYVTGFISTGSGTVNFGAEAVTVVGMKDAFFAKYNGADGTNLWAKGIGAANDDTGGGLTIDGTSAIVLGGGFNGTADFDPGAATNSQTTNGASDIFIARYTQCSAPIISTQPTAQSVCAGSPATFTIVASGGTLSYQWKLGSTNVGTNSATLTISSPGAGDVGSYTVVVSNTCPASVTSTAVNLSLKTATSITTNPSFSGPVCTGSTLNLSVVAAGSNLSYQWKQGSTNVGTNSASYSKPSATTADNGSYTVVVTGDCGALTSTATAVTIGTTTSITTQPSYTATCQGATLNLSVVAAGSNLTYQWKQGSTNVGTSSATYSKASSTTADNGSYTVLVTGDCGTVTSSATTVTISTPPSISVQPVATSACAGSPASFSVTATGTGLSYQWKNGSTNVGSNSATYNIASAAAGDVGSYTVVVSGSCTPSVTSSAVAFALKTPTSITTQPTFTGPVCTGSTLTLSVVAAGSNLSYAWKQGLSSVGTNSATYSKPSASVSDNGNYTVDVTGDCGTVTSSVVAVAITAPPTITTQPTAQNVCSGSPASFSVVVSSASTVSYQWKLGSTNVGTNSATLSIPSAAAGDVGSYTVVVSNGCTPNATSSAAALTLKTPTSITTQPSFTGPVCQGSTLSLSVVAAGNGTLSYVWKQGATTVGTNSSTYSQVSAATTDDGSYTVIVTGDCGSVTSSATTVTISVPPTITTQPTDQSKCSGLPATFTVVASGTSPLNYQWKKGGSNVGTNSPTYTIPSPGPGNAGNYTVTVSNVCAPSVTSNTVTLVVGTTTSITTQPTFTGPLCQGSTLSLSVVATGSGTLSYVWKQGSTTVGTNSASYSKPSSTIADNGSYTVIVTGDCGSVTSSVATVSISTPASITTQPTDESICSGSPATFTVAAAGTAPLTYVWKKGATTVGTNSPTYTISSPVAGDAGSYSVIVSNVCTPSVTSNTVTLGVGTTTAISTHPSFSGPLCQGSALTLSVVATGSNLSYQWKQGSTNVGSSSATYTQASASSSDDGSYTVVVTGDCGVVTSNATTVTISTPPTITTQPLAANACPTTSATFTVVATGTGLSYQWVKGTSTNVGTNSASYTIPSVVAGDAGNYHVVITGSCAPAVTSNDAALTVGGSPVINTQPASQSVCIGATTTLSVVASGSGLTYQWKKGGADLGGEVASTLVIDPTAVADAGSYTVSVISGCGSVLSSAAVLTVKTLPSITNQPTAQSVCDGSALNISVLASGSSLTYQWSKDGTDISGAQSATYNVPAASSADAGSYAVLVSNGCAPDVLSNTVPVTIKDLPAITMQPVNVSVCATGMSATFNVTATGTGLSYQWKKNGTINVGPNSDTYTIPSVLVGDVGNYAVVVSGACAPAVTSNTVTLSVTPGTITIVTQPTGQTLCTGDNLDLSVSATGPSLVYQWKKGTTDLSDGGSVGGATTNNLVITGVVSSDGGNYTCEISSSCASTVTSNTATVAVSTCTGVMAQKGNMFYVSPNPGADNFYLNAEGMPDGEASISVMNTLGHEVYKGSALISGGTMQQLLPVDLSSGMYTIVLSSGDNRYSTKMVVQK